MNKKIILFTGGVETLEYFSLQLNNSFIEMGYETFLFDLNDQFDSFNKLIQFCKSGDATMITFNFIGLSGEEIFNSNGVFFFDTYNIKCLNIVVDHPFYYHKNYANLPKHYIQFCIDKTHMEYMMRFYKNVELGEFLPLAGSSCKKVNINGMKPISEKNIDIMFAGNYTPPSRFEAQITRINDDYTKFYYGIIDDLLDNPSQSMDEVFLKHLALEIPDLSDDDLATCMANMIFIDLYVRFTVRGNVLRTLIDNGFKIHGFGAGLNLVKYKHPENLIHYGGVNSITCLRKQYRSKISLNVMPWFKNGAHDRIFNASMNGAVSLSDDSIYLRELFDDKSIAFYDLKCLDKLPDIAERLLNDDSLLETMSKNAYEITSNAHTWRHRALTLAKYI